MELLIKCLIGLGCLLGGGCSIGLPLVMSNNNSSNIGNLEKQENLLSKASDPAGGGDSSKKLEKTCQSIIDRTVKSISNLMRFKHISSEEKVSLTLNESTSRSLCINAIVKPGNSYSTKSELVEGVDGTKGVESIVKKSIEKLQESQESSIGGGRNGDGSSSSQVEDGKKSFVLTGASNGGEYLMGIDGLKHFQDKQEGVMLVAKKEEVTSLGTVELQIGGKEGTQQGSSPQLQIDKKDLTNWEVKLEFRKYDLLKTEV